MTAVDVNADEICGGFLEPLLLIARVKPDISIRPTRERDTEQRQLLVKWTQRFRS